MGSENIVNLTHTQDENNSWFINQNIKKKPANTWQHRHHGNKSTILNKHNVEQKTKRDSTQQQTLRTMNGHKRKGINSKSY